MPKSQAALRKEVYDFIRNKLGLEMNLSQQSEISSILKSVYETRFVEARKENDAPLKHEIVCPKCGDYRLKIGRQFKNYKKRLPKEIKEQTK